MIIMIYRHNICTESVVFIFIFDDNDVYIQNMYKLSNI